MTCQRQGRLEVEDGVVFQMLTQDNQDLLGQKCTRSQDIAGALEQYARILEECADHVGTSAEVTGWLYKTEECISTLWCFLETADVTQCHCPSLLYLYWSLERYHKSRPACVPLLYDVARCLCKLEGEQTWKSEVAKWCERAIEEDIDRAYYCTVLARSQQDPWMKVMFMAAATMYSQAQWQPKDLEKVLRELLEATSVRTGAAAAIIRLHSKALNDCMTMQPTQLDPGFCTAVLDFLPQQNKSTLLASGMMAMAVIWGHEINPLRLPFNATADICSSHGPTMTMGEFWASSLNRIATINESGRAFDFDTSIPYVRVNMIWLLGLAKASKGVKGSAEVDLKSKMASMIDGSVLARFLNFIASINKEILGASKSEIDALGVTCLSTALDTAVLSTQWASSVCCQGRKNSDSLQDEVRFLHLVCRKVVLSSIASLDLDFDESERQFLAKGWNWELVDE